MAWKTTSPGYVITSAKITRAGEVEYYGHEIGLTGSDANKKIIIQRTIEELSKPETIASFEGQTLTLLHPDSGEVNADEWKDKAIGHIQNVRVSGDYLVCDVYLKDAAAIAVIKKLGLRELSCGYEPAQIIDINGKLYQINIRGNHVAVVPEGRIGADCRLNDKKGRPMKKFSLKDVVALLKGKRPNDAEGQPLTEDEINSMIAALETALAELEGKEGVDGAVADLTAQIEELKAQLEAMKVNPNDIDTGGDKKDARITELEAENATLKARVAELEEELANVRGEQETASVMNDAKARFPKVNLTDSKSARDVQERVLVGLGVFTDSQAKALTNEQVQAAYAAAQVTTKPRSTIGDRLLNDSKSQPKKTATQRLGGK